MEIIKKLKREAIKVYFKEKSGHDFSHIRRCLKYANKILKIDGGNEFIVKTAILFHDMHWMTFAVLYLSHLITDLLKARYNFIGYLEDQLIHYVVAFWLFWFKPF